MIYKIINFILSKKDHEEKKDLLLKIMKFFNKTPLNFLIKNKFPNNNISCMGLNFKNILGLAAGLDKNGDYIKLFSDIGFGFIELGTVTLKPQHGEKKPRLFCFPNVYGIINRMGFNNNGIENLIENIKNEKNVKSILGINIGKNKDTLIEKAKDDYLICINKAYYYSDYISINISSPNTKDLRKLQFGELFSDLLKSIKEEQNKLNKIYNKYVPILIKISPDINNSEIIQISDCLLSYNIDGVIATNTTVNKDIIMRCCNNCEKGGLSGAPLNENSTRIIKKLSKELKGKIPIIGSGGIISVKSAKEKIKAGASLIQIYSGLVFFGLKIIKKLIKSF
ncbi:pyrD [Wigglesworthia glossinidia endosymbiont of Glossina brevipalpis]|uniref:Dihydroorotate dehydrogenase (quinone) n=1 Tax=Wigglesworthia glossinidia brevipalpis TaxID=36870 RepID=PYRD_WIGBR|nr:RecName: Full=Dihydroorotate dehydrogenase (quinone); AltName: Full=DHOdehase; Short=DHOD; Short=DHODase; AltName: Full=Dihydroorotate oxidase [Wigglesworthia glossinidia endosymbiont of Glossina brevipalpis]BAC24277.1 pyrD [Wigglesworthia glossinidia endosymbiont of Glossina brevipalpis]